MSPVSLRPQIISGFFSLPPVDTVSANFTPSHQFEHLSCFLPGLLALGAHTLPLSDPSVDLASLSQSFSPNAREGYAKLASFNNLTAVHIWAAEALAQTCYLSYADQPSGLGADEMVMFTGEEPAGRKYKYKGGGTKWIDALIKWDEAGREGPRPGEKMGEPVVFTIAMRMKRPPPDEKLRDYTIRRTGYLLRPEVRMLSPYLTEADHGLCEQTLESLYLLWRLTGDARWRDYGWNIFDAIEAQSKRPYGYASAGDVQVTPVNVLNQQPR